MSGTRKTAEEVIRLYDRERHRDHAYYFGGHDARVCARAFYAMCLWGLGYPDQAERMAGNCIEDARALGHTFSLSHGLNMSSLTLVLLGDVRACQTITEELYPLAERNKFPWPLATAHFLRGWLRSQQGDRAGGIEQMLTSIDEPSHSVLRPMFLTLIAEQELRTGRFADALRTLDRAGNDILAGAMVFYEPEVIRMRGEILLAQSPAGAAEAEAAFRQARAIAAQQACRALELRAALSLARLCIDSGRGSAAREVLAPIYSSFTEGFARAELQAAKSLLAELS